MDASRTLLPGCDQDARLAPKIVIVMRRAGGVLQRCTPGGNTMMSDHCSDQYHVVGRCRVVGKISVVSMQLTERVSVSP